LQVSLPERNKVQARCIFHDDKTPSLSLDLKIGTWFCHACNVGGGILDFERKLTGKPDSECWDAINTIIGREAPKASKPKHGAIVATYDYHDAAGKVVYEAVRYEPKSFKRRRPDGKGGWTWNMDGITRVPFNLPALVRANVALIAEGEKDLLNLQKAATDFPNENGKLSYAATTNIGGAGQWLNEYSPYFAGKKVFIFQDNDDAGRKHALEVCASVSKYAQAVHLVELPGLPAKGDVSDYLEKHTPAELFELMKSAPVWTPMVVDMMRRYPPGDLDGSIVPPQYADDSLALKFTAKHGENLRYTSAMGRWSKWTGNRWERDETLAVFDLARDTCREEGIACEDKRIGARIASAQTVSAVERLARADRRHAATVEQWDVDPWVLNTPGGLVDLRTGGSRPSRREDYLTKLTAVAPRGDCAIWRKFLERVTDGKQELVDFLQRMCGYALTGVTREHAMFFLFGTGANGKSVFLNTMLGVFGDYAKTAPIETFIDSKNQAHPTDVASLQGARLVTAVETEDGRRWAESKLKALTGGDRIAARYMRQDFFEFSPAFKLVVAGNHKPGLRSVDEAIKRRFNLVPFTVTILAAERDPELAEKLKAEWPGILQWAVDGCLAWQRDGLNTPPVVETATREYFAAEDALSRWLEDRTELKPGFWENASDLFRNWKEWAESGGEFVGSQKRFSESLASKGVAQVRKKTGRGFEGIRLRGSVVRDGGKSAPSDNHKLLEDTQEKGRFEL
jgi:putative DNA primase/helicase